MQDREGGLESGQLVGRRANEHVPGKQAVPGSVGDHPHRQAIGRIGAGVKILDEQLMPLKIGEHALAEALKALGRERAG